MKGMGNKSWKMVYENERMENRFIYFVLAKQTNLVKIGRTFQPSKRFEHLESSNADSLEVVLLMVEGNKFEEQHLHKEFADLRHHCEWFRYEEPIKEYVDKINSTSDAINEEGWDERK